jgi:phosphoribosylformylglycinamidine synthase
MMLFRIAIQVMPRGGILDPQGQAIAGALHALGYDGVNSVRLGKQIDLQLQAKSESAARDAAAQMCDKLLANPVTEDYLVAEVTQI